MLDAGDRIAIVVFAAYAFGIVMGSVSVVCR